MPNTGFEFGYKSSVTEQLRWSCVEARVRNILSTNVKYEVVPSCVVTLDEYVVVNRNSYCK